MEAATRRQAVFVCMYFKFKVNILVVHGASECERIGNSGLSLCTNESMLLSLRVCVCTFVCMYIFGLYDKPVWHVSLSKRERERERSETAVWQSERALHATTVEQRNRQTKRANRASNKEEEEANEKHNQKKSASNKKFVKYMCVRMHLCMYVCACMQVYMHVCLYVFHYTKRMQLSVYECRVCTVHHLCITK